LAGAPPSQTAKQPPAKSEFIFEQTLKPGTRGHGCPRSNLESAPGFNRNRDFGFARGVRTIILAAMAHRKLIPLGSLFLAVAGIAAEQAANAVVEKAKQTTPIQDKIISYLIDHSGQLIAATLIVVLGFVVSRTVAKFAELWLAQKPIEPPIRLLAVRIVRLAVLLLAFVIALGTAGADVTALITGLGVAGVGVGLAMQGVLSNFVAGLTIIFTKPFRVGEYVEMLGVQGSV